MWLRPVRWGKVLPFAPILIFLTSPMPAAAAVILYSTGFEPPTFTAGPIAGQDGWQVFGPGVSTVENTFVKTGVQSEFVDGSTGSQSGPFRGSLSAGPIIDLSADVAIFSSSTQSEWQFAALAPGLSQFLGGIDVFPDNAIEVISAGFPVIGTFPRATAFNASAWHHIDLLFDLTTQTYDVSLDGSTLASNVPICGDDLSCAGALVSNYGDGFFDSFGEKTFGGRPGTDDSGYMDNFRASNVPEPSTVGMLLMGMALAGAGFRRSARRR